MGWEWKTAPVYPGVELDLGDIGYIPSTKEKYLYYATELIPDKDFSRIREQTYGNYGYILRPYSQSDWKPNVTKPQVTKNSKASTDNPRVSTPPKTNKPRIVSKAPASDSWINKNKKIWNYNGVSQADVANAYKTGDFSKVRNYLSQHKDLASYLNNIYSKRGGNQFNLSTSTQQTTPTQGSPSRGIHVGNNRVTYVDAQGNTTDVTNSHNLLETIWGKQGQPSVNTQFLEQTASNLINPNQHTFNRRETKDFMRQNLLNPYDYSASERGAFRHSISNDTGDWSNASKIMLDARINKSLSKSIDAEKNQFLVNPQLSKPNLGYDPSQNNQLVNLKFKQGGLLKFQNGGANQDQIMEAFKQWVAQKLQNGELEKSDLKDQKKLEQLFQSFIKEQQGVQTAMNGAKLNYINKLNGKCPQGTHLSYYRIGGTLCKKCEADAYNESSDPIKAFKQKCGGKVKKAVKQKCGGKVKKKELGGEVDDKKNQPKPKLVKKPQNKIIPKKPQNPRPGPKDLKKLPNGKYPKYWTADQRGQWDRDHDEGV